MRLNSVCVTRQNIALLSYLYVCFRTQHSNFSTALIQILSAYRTVYVYENNSW